MRGGWSAGIHYRWPDTFALERAPQIELVVLYHAADAEIILAHGDLRREHQSAFGTEIVNARRQFGRERSVGSGASEIKVSCHAILKMKLAISCRCAAAIDVGTGHHRGFGCARSEQGKRDCESDR